jgi:hypothetical protein
MTKNESKAANGNKPSGPVEILRPALRSAGLPRAISRGVSPALFLRAISAKLDINPAKGHPPLEGASARGAMGRFLIDIWRLEMSVTYRKYAMATKSNRHGHEGSL